MAYHNRTSSSSLLVIPGPRQRGDGNLYDPRSVDVYPCAVPQKNPTRRMDPTKMPRRAIDLFAGLKLKERVTFKRRRRSVVVAIPGKERKSGSDSSAKKKIQNLRELNISRPVLNSGWELGNLIVSGEDHPGLTGPPPPTPASGKSPRPASPLLPERPSPRSMLVGPPSQRSLPSIPPSPKSPLSVHRPVTPARPGPPPPAQFFAGTTPPRTPLPEIPLTVARNLRLSPSSPPKPPSRSLRKEQWPLRDDIFLETTPKALSTHHCPEPLRRPPTAPGFSSPSSFAPEPRKESPKTTFGLWPAQELSSKPQSTRVFSNSLKQPGAEPCGGDSPYSSPTSLEIRKKPSSSLACPSHRRGPRFGELPTSSTLYSSRRVPRGGEPLVSSPSFPRPGIEAALLPTRSIYPSQEPRGGEPLVSSPASPRPGIEPALLPTRSIYHPQERLRADSPTLGTTGPEPRTDPSASRSYQIPRPIPGSGPTPVSKQNKRGLPALHKKIEHRDESVRSNVPLVSHLPLASTKDKHITQMAKGEQELENLAEKVRLYEDFFLTLEAGRSSSFIAGDGGQRERRGKPKSLEELKERLEAQLRVMKAEEMAKGSGWF